VAFQNSLGSLQPPAPSSTCDGSARMQHPFTHDLYIYIIFTLNTYLSAQKHLSICENDKKKKKRRKKAKLLRTHTHMKEKKKKIIIHVNNNKPVHEIVN
jgi:hypothetical protein